MEKRPDNPRTGAILLLSGDRRSAFGVTPFALTASAKARARRRPKRHRTGTGPRCRSKEKGRLAAPENPANSVVPQSQPASDDSIMDRLKAITDAVLSRYGFVA